MSAALDLLRAVLLAAALLPAAPAAPAAQEPSADYLQTLEAVPEGGWIRRQFEQFRAWPQLDRALRLQAEGDLPAARTLAARMVAERPEDARGHFLLAVLALSAGDYATAEAATAAVLQLRPDFGPAQLYRGLALAALERPAEAVESLLPASRAEDLAPADRRAAVDALAEAAVAAERFDLALETLERAGEAESYRYRRLQGMILEGQERHDAAHRAFAAAAALAGSEAEHREALRFAAESARRAGQPEEARALLLDLLTADPEDLETLRLLAWLEAVRGETARAVDWIELALALDPDADTRLYFVNLLVEQGEPEAGIALAERQAREVADAATRHRLLMLLGHLQFERGALIASAQAFRQAAEVLDDFDALIALVAVYERGDNLRDAAAVLEDLARRFGLEGVAYRLIALYERAGDLEAALRVIEDAWRANDAPDYRAELLYRRSLILGRLGEEEGELEALREAVGLQPDNRLYRLALGEREYALANFPEAVEAFSAALALEADLDTRRRLANAQAAAGRIEEATANFELLLREAPAGSEERADILARLGNLYARQERYEPSARAFVTSYRELPAQGAELLVQGALSFAQARILDEAAAALNEALRVLPEGDPLRAEAHERAAVVAEQRDRPAEAIGHYDRLLAASDLDPGRRLVLLRRLAVVAELARDYAAAARAYRGIVDNPRTDPATRRETLGRLAVAAELAGDYEGSIAAYRRILAEPALEPPQRIDALRRMAIIANVAGLLDIAREAYTALVTGDEVPIAARIEAARSLAYVADLTEETGGVVEAFQGLLARAELEGESRIEVLEGLALTADLAGRPEVTVAAYEQLLGLLPADAEARGRVLDNLAAAYERIGRYEEAVPLYQALLQRPEAAERERRIALLQRLAVAAEQLGDSELALGAFEEIVALGTDDWGLFERFGLALRSTGDCERALRVFHQARRLGAGAQTDIYASFCYVDEGRPGLAIHFLERALAEETAELTPSTRIILTGSLGFLYAESGQYAQAAAAWRQVAAVAPDPELLLRLARAERLSGEIEAAALLLARLDPEELQPTLRPDYYDEFSDVERARGAPETALAALDQAIELDPRAERIFRRGVLLTDLGLREEAFEDLLAAQEREPENRVFAAALAYAHDFRGEAAEAAELLEWVVRAEPDRLAPYQDLAYISKRLYRNQEAIAWFERAVDNRPLYPVHDEEDEVALRRLMFELRRENQTLHNDWDLSGYVIARSEVAGAPRFDPTGRSSMTAQGGVELAHRPDWLELPDGSPVGFRDGAIVQAFGRVFWGFERNSLTPDRDTLQGGLGLRWKPFGETNFFLSGERLVKLGALARNGWLLRASHSWDIGFDIDPVRSNWTYAQTYADAAYIPGRDYALFLTGEARLGRSFKLHDENGLGVVVTPHAVAAASYSRNRFASDRFGEIGLGVSGKLWFDETPYQAYRSSSEMTLQYRTGLDKRNRLSHGLLLSLTVSF